jgi:hypothetical protein
MTSVPNFGHWYPRARVAAGRFDYDRRGILDRDHVRFFTRRSFERLALSTGLTPRRREAVGLPFEVAARGTGGDGGSNGLNRIASRIDQLGVTLAPTLFAYQFLFELEPALPPDGRVVTGAVDPRTPRSAGRD